jgi:hypothetical protein
VRKIIHHESIHVGLGKSHPASLVPDQNIQPLGWDFPNPTWILMMDSYSLITSCWRHPTWSIPIALLRSFSETRERFPFWIYCNRSVLFVYKRVRKDTPVDDCMVSTATNCLLTIVMYRLDPKGEFKVGCYNWMFVLWWLNILYHCIEMIRSPYQLSYTLNNSDRVRLRQHI